MNDTQDRPEGFLEDHRHDLPLQLHYELDDRPLSVWAFRVYAHFVRRAGRNGRIFPTYKSIAEKCFRPTFPDAKPETLKRRAMEAVKELEAQGLVRVVRSRAADGDNNPNVYHLTARSAWHPLVQCTPPGAMHPPSATHPEVNQVQANQDKEVKDGAQERAGRNQAQPEAVQDSTALPPVSKNREEQSLSPEPSKATALEQVPRGPARPEDVPIPAPLMALEGFTEAWGEWLAYRRARRLSCLPVTLRAQLKFLGTQPDPLAVIAQTITQGWAGLFPLKGGPGKPRTQQEANEQFIRNVEASRAALDGVFND